MNAFAQRIAALQKPRQAPRQAVDGADLRRQARVGNLSNQRSPLVNESGRVFGKLDDRVAQLRRRAGRRKHLDRRAMSAKNLQRQVDTVELSIVVGAILQMVDHLQRGAQRVGRRPKGLRFAMDIEHNRPTGIADSRQ